MRMNKENMQEEYEAALYMAVSDLKYYEKIRKEKGKTLEEDYEERCEAVYNEYKGKGIIPIVEYEDRFAMAYNDFVYACRKLELDPIEVMKEKGIEPFKIGNI